MAVPTLTTDITMIDNADDGTSWSGWDINAAKWDDEADIYIEGAGSQGLQPNATGDGGYGYELAASINLSVTGDRLFIWVYTTPGFLTASASKGVYVRICTSTTSWTTEYNDYVVGGSDVEWVGRGWHLIALDCSQTPTTDVGATTLTNINRVGVGFNHSATASKSTVTAIDVMYYGTYVEVTGVASSSASHSFAASTKTITRGVGDFSADGFEIGDTIVIAGTVNNNGEFTTVTVGTTTMTVSETIVDETTVTSTIDAYVTWENIYEKDGPTDDDWFGIITKNPLGVWEINYTLYLGDQSGANNLYFRTHGEQITFADQWMGIGELAIITTEDTGKTVFEVGDSTGTGDDRVGFSGSVFSHYNDFHASEATVDLSAAITDCFIYGASFLGLDAGVDFAADTSHKAFNCTFDACGQVDLGSVEARNLVFSGYNLVTDAALLWNANIDIESSSFLANRNTAGTAHAIEHPSEGTFSYSSLAFSGNDYDVANATLAVLVDSYAPTEDGDVDVYSGSIIRVAQQFTGTAGELSRAIFSIRKQGSPTGSVYARLYANSGSAPTGAALAESTALDISTLTTSFEDIGIQFEDEYTLSAATEYHISIEYDGGDAGNRLEVEYLAAGDGSETCNTYDGSWGGQTYDCRFQVNKDGIITINATDSNPGTADETAAVKGATIIINTVLLDVLVEDQSGTAIVDAQVAIYKLTDNTQLMNEASIAGGIAQEDFNYPGSTVDIYIRVRKASSGTKYVPYYTEGTIDGNGYTLHVLMTEDPIA